MPESGYTPQGDTAVGGNDFTPPKKKKKADPVEVVAAPRHEQATKGGHDRKVPSHPETGDTSGVNPETGQLQVTPHRVKTFLPDLGPRQRRTVSDEVLMGALSDRAGQISPALAKENPGMAAELLISPHPTSELQDTSQALYEGLRHLDQKMQADGVPGQMRPYYQAAISIPNKENRALALATLDRISHLPDAQRMSAIEALQQGVDVTSPEYKAAVAAQGEGEDPFSGGFWGDTFARVQQGFGVLGEASIGVATALTFPIAIASKLTGNDFRDPVRTFAEGGMYGLRVGIGAGGFATASAFGVTDPSKSLLDQLDEYVPSWSEYKSGENSGATQALFQISGADPKDYPTLAAATDMAIDVIVSDVAFKAVSAIKLSRTATPLGGGKTPGDAWVTSTAGRELLDVVEDTKMAFPETPTAALLDRVPHMSAQLAEELVKASTRSDMERVFASSIDDVPSRLMEQARVELDQVHEALQEPNLSDADISSLKSEQAALEQHIVDLGRREPTYEYPTRSRMRAAMRGTSDSRTGRLLNYFFGNTKKLDVSLLTDDLNPRALKLWNRAREVPEGAVEATVDALRKEMNIGKVPVEMQRSVIEQYLYVKSDADFFDFQHSLSRAFEEGFTRGGARELTPEGQQVISFSKRETYVERLQSPVQDTASLPDGTSASRTRNVLEDVDGNPLPTQENEFAGHAYLPDPKLVREASSTTHYWDTRKSWLGGAYRMAHTPLDVVNYVALKLPELILKPLTLVTRIIPMEFKIQVDQAIRLHTTGYRLLKMFRRTNPEYAQILEDAGLEPGPAGILTKKTQLTETAATGLGEGDVTPLGLIAENLDRSEAYTHLEQTRGLNPMNDHPGTTERVNLVARAVQEQVVHLADSEVVKRLVTTGPEDTLRYIEDHPTSRMTRWVESQMDPVLARAGKTRLEWLQDKERQVGQLVGGNQELRRAIANGKWEVGRDVPTGERIQLDMYRDELDSARTAAVNETDPIIRREYQLRAEEIEHSIARLEKRLQANTFVDIRDNEAFANELLNAWTEGRWTPPSEIPVTKYLPNADEMSFTRYMRHLNQKLYGGLRPLTKVELAGTRGEVAQQEAVTIYQRLIEQGFDKDTAAKTAIARGMLKSRELMYDLGSRTSIERRLSALFWFAPVWKEQLVTYLWKVPSQAYPGVGHAILYGEAQSIITGLRNLGILKTDTITYTDADGKTVKRDIPVVSIPWLTPFIAKNFGGTGNIDVEGLNPLTPGGAGVVPTLSPGAEALLDFAGDHVPNDDVKAAIDWFSRMFTFDKGEPGSRFLPSAITYALNLAGVAVPDDLKWDEAQARAHIASIRWAQQDLANDGVLPPKAKASDKEWQAYTDRVEAEARNHEAGMAFFHILALALPLPAGPNVSNVNPTQTAYYGSMEEWVRSEGLPDNRDVWTDAQWTRYSAWKEAYVRVHPEALGYATSQWEDYEEQIRVDANTFVDNLRSTAKRAADGAKPDGTPLSVPDTTTPHGQVGVAALATNQGSVKNVTLSASALPVGQTELNDDQLNALGYPDYADRQHVLNQARSILIAFDRKYSSEDSETQKARLYETRDKALGFLSKKYGQDGAETIRLVTSSPAERLRTAGTFTTRAAETSIAEANRVTRLALSKGSSPMYAAESTGVLQAKIDLYRQVNRSRKDNAAFDREVRRVELALDVKDNPNGQVAAYEYIFFNQPVNAFGYQASIARGL